VRRKMMSRERSKPYAEDSTKGGSLINPLKFKGDVLVQVWIDSRVLATLTKWMERAGEHPRFLSHVVKRPLEVMASYLVEGGEVEMVEDTAEAREMLEIRFGVELNRGGRGKKNVLHNMTLADRVGEMREIMKKQEINRPRTVTQSELVRRGVEIYRKLERGEKVNVSEKMSEEEFSTKMDEIAQGDQEDIERMKSVDLNEFV
jgi:hypothetical protein